MTLHVNVLNEMTLAIALQTSSHAQWLARAPQTFQLMNWCVQIFIRFRLCLAMKMITRVKTNLQQVSWEVLKSREHGLGINMGKI